MTCPGRATGGRCLPGRSNTFGTCSFSDATSGGDWTESEDIKGAISVGICEL
jgi:hypothetical protein